MFSAPFNRTGFNRRAGTVEQVFIYFGGDSLTVSFTNGSKELTPGMRIRGTRTKAIGIIESCTLVSGSWVGGTAAGTVLVTMKSGQFIYGEDFEEVTG